MCLFKAVKNMTDLNGNADSEEWGCFLLFFLWASTFVVFPVYFFFVLITKSSALLNLVSFIASLAIFIPGLTVSIRRMHHVGYSGWFIFIPYLMWFLIFPVFGYFYILPAISALAKTFFLALELPSTFEKYFMVILIFMFIYIGIMLLKGHPGKYVSIRFEDDEDDENIDEIDEGDQTEEPFEDDGLDF